MRIKRLPSLKRSCSIDSCGSVSLLRKLIKQQQQQQQQHDSAKRMFDFTSVYSKYFRRSFVSERMVCILNGNGLAAARRFRQRGPQRTDWLTDSASKKKRKESDDRHELREDSNHHRSHHSDEWWAMGDGRVRSLTADPLGGTGTGTGTGTGSSVHPSSSSTSYGVPALTVQSCDVLLMNIPIQKSIFSIESLNSYCDVVTHNY